MDDEIELAPFFAQHIEGRVDTGDVLDVARQHQFDAELLRQWLDSLA
ncbi:hypothetical protein ACVILJ_004670 [Bradyrhizobium diazoefficiens]